MKSRLKTPVNRSRKHLDFIKTLPCLVCSTTPCDPAHIRSGGKWDADKGGTSRKPGDNRTVPLCRTHHDTQHRIGERVFWGNPETALEIANALWVHTGNREECMKVIYRSRLNSRS